jgi:hypothetical protein
LFSLSLVAFFALLGCAGPVPSTPSGASSTPTPSPQVPQQSKARPREQTKFGVEEEVEHPVDLPEDVLQILRRDERNQQSLSQGQSPNDIPASWFVASQVRLNDDDLPDLIVTAADPRLLGANVAPFWVFRNTPQGHRLALSVSALSLEVLNTRTQRYRDIRATAATANKVLTTLFRFNGSAYRARR